MVGAPGDRRVPCDPAPRSYRIRAPSRQARRAAALLDDAGLDDAIDQVRAITAAPGGQLRVAVTGRFDGFWPDAPHRVLRSALEAAERHPSETVGSMSVGAERATIPRFAGLAPVTDAEGEIEAMACFAGEGVGEVDAILPAREIAARLAAGPDARLRTLRQRLAPSP